jgi:glutamate racemase
LLVPLAEEGFLTGPVVEAVLDHHLADLHAAKIESLVLGCTHYPILKDAIENWFLQREHSLTIVDSADAAAEAVASALPSTASDGQGRLHVMVTDAADRFTDIANRFLGAEIGLELVDL